MARSLPLALVALLLLAPAAALADGAAYWVWHRSTPLRAEETAELQRQAATALYWHAGELAQRRGEWRWKGSPLAVAHLAAKLPVVPTVRLTTEAVEPFSRAANASLARALRQVAEGGAVQLDYDCPDRLLGRYAAALAELRREFPRLSITALAHWSRAPEWPALQAAVTELAPMFYDLQADPTGVGPGTSPPPLLDPVQVEKALVEWSACKVPWRAGLPAFARLTVFDRTGASRGQIPNWSWEDCCFHKQLRTLGPTRLGVTLFRAATDTRLAGTALAAGEYVSARFTDRVPLARTAARATELGAAGVILFRLPDETDPAGWSLRDLGALTAPLPPRLAVIATPQQIELRNDSPADLGPRLSGAGGDRDRGWQLELDAPAPIFREALPGGFWRITSHVHPDTPQQAPAAVPLATRLTFWFSHLPAGGALRTSLFQLAPGATLRGVRHRIVHLEGADEWKTFVPR